MKTHVYPASCKGFSRIFYSRQITCIQPMSFHAAWFPCLNWYFISLLVWRPNNMGCRGSHGTPCLQGPHKAGTMMLAGHVKVKCGCKCPQIHVHLSLRLLSACIDTHLMTFLGKSLININDNWKVWSLHNIAYCEKKGQEGKMGLKIWVFVKYINNIQLFLIIHGFWICK